MNASTLRQRGLVCDCAPTHGLGGAGAVPSFMFIKEEGQFQKQKETRTNPQKKRLPLTKRSDYNNHSPRVALRNFERIFDPNRSGKGGLFFYWGPPAILYGDTPARTGGAPLGKSERTPHSRVGQDNLCPTSELYDCNMGLNKKYALQILGVQWDLAEPFMGVPLRFPAPLRQNRNMENENFLTHKSEAWEAPQSEPRRGGGENLRRARIVEKCQNYFWHFLMTFDCILRRKIAVP